MITIEWSINVLEILYISITWFTIFSGVATLFSIAFYYSTNRIISKRAEWFMNVLVNGLVYSGSILFIDIVALMVLEIFF